ncbi:MAG: dihydrodipicolinate synthase family protein [Candidatus Shikimatogenerans bostrichidophilus]|nr:MAG: dihydrodipicolinate synthase family protein [Candidatus Shikimatogenerans bostrichidophilus]
MKKLNISIPIVTPFDKKNNIDFFSLEKLIFYISNLEHINNIILFSKYSEYYSLSTNEKIDIINCIQNNNKKNINIILKINNIYNYNDVIYIINQKIYKNIYYIIIDYPNISNIYKKDIINNYNKIFKYFKYLYFFISIKNKNIDENIFNKIKETNKNFIGLIDQCNYEIYKYDLINNIKIIINNDIYLLKNIYNIDGIISPLFLFFFDYINNYIIKNIQNNKSFLYDKNYLNLIYFINILYKKINPISGVKFLLNIIGICKIYMKLPCNNIDNIIFYNNIKDIYNKIIN